MGGKIRAVPEHPAFAHPQLMAAGYGGDAVVVFVAIHVLFGVIVGAGYRMTPRLAADRRQGASKRRAPMSHGPA